jgi:signal transduction histidine kinase
MKQNARNIVLTIILLVLASPVFSQNTAENLKTALIYKIANCVIWSNDTSGFFEIGVLSDNPLLIEKFQELSRVAKINRKPIRVTSFRSDNTLKKVHLLYVDENYNRFISSIIKATVNQNTLLVSVEHNQPGEIMVNLRLDPQREIYTFEYNRANILFAGLDLTEEIVLLKGTEVEIRELYLQAKKLWDEQQLVAELQKQADRLNANIVNQQDSILKIKTVVEENQFRISQQLYVLAQKDSFLNNLNSKINFQQIKLDQNLIEAMKLIQERNKGEEVIRSQKLEINKKLALSDSLTNQIEVKQKELLDKNRAILEKETLIQKQSNWLLIAIVIILIVGSLVFYISRAYIQIRRAKHKIAEQKERLESIVIELQKTQQQLVHSEKMASLGVLVAGVAHEINNPINYINSGIAGVEKSIDKIVRLLNELKQFTDESTQEDVKRLVEFMDDLNIEKTLDILPEVVANIKIGVNRTIEITNGLRLYTRMDKEDKSLCDIREIIDTALLMLNSKINKSIEIVKNYEPLPLVYVYPGKLGQVFLNILSNAIDAVFSSDDGGANPIITIQTKEVDGKIVIEISDTGTGIPIEILNKIFDPFFTTKKVGSGTGLGLPISATIIEEHQGVIYAKNNPVKGAAFVIELPVNTK